jgi:hypothetical protein
MNHLEHQLERIKELALLKDGWLDGDGKVPTKLAIELAIVVLANLKPHVPLGSLFPRPDGGLQYEIEWSPDKTKTPDSCLMEPWWYRPCRIRLGVGTMMMVAIYPRQTTSEVHICLHHWILMATPELPPAHIIDDEKRRRQKPEQPRPQLPVPEPPEPSSEPHQAISGAKTPNF